MLLANDLTASVQSRLSCLFFFIRPEEADYMSDFWILIVI